MDHDGKCTVEEGLGDLCEKDIHGTPSIEGVDRFLCKLIMIWLFLLYDGKSLKWKRRTIFTKC